MIKESFRMAQWLLLSVLAYWLASTLALMPGDTEAGAWPRIQTVLWKIGHLNLAAYIGFWIDRNAFRTRVMFHSAPTLQMRRAVIIAATMIAFGLAL